MRLCKENDSKRATKESADKPKAGTRSKRLEALTLFTGKCSCRWGRTRLASQGSTGDVPRLGLRQGLMSAYPKRVGSSQG
jgi:hypothetical protein